MMKFKIPESIQAYCRKATLLDCFKIGLSMRKDDADDIRCLSATPFYTPLLAVLHSWLRSKVSVVWHRPGESDKPMGIGGVCGDGVIWSLFRDGFPRDLKDRKNFLKISRVSIAMFGHYYEEYVQGPHYILYNMTRSVNKHIIHWMKACGAETASEGSDGKPFTRQGHPVTLFWFNTPKELERINIKERRRNSY